LFFEGQINVCKKYRNGGCLNIMDKQSSQQKIVFNDEYFMRLALQEAIKAYEHGEVPVGAVVVCNNRIIAKSHNQVERLKDATAHAEMLALSAAFSYIGGKYLPDCTLYVTLEPCLMCASATFWSKLSRIVFAARDMRLGYMAFGASALHPKTKVCSGILEEESQKKLQSFFAKLRE
jgi:tRNA(adenine34) deaminase